MDIEDELLCVLAAVIIQRKKTKGMVSEGLIALVTWNTRGSHSIAKFKYNSYKHFEGLVLLVGDLCNLIKLKYFLIKKKFHDT